LEDVISTISSKYLSPSALQYAIFAKYFKEMIVVKRVCGRKIRLSSQTSVNLTFVMKKRIYGFYTAFRAYEIQPSLIVKREPNIVCLDIATGSGWIALTPQTVR